KDYGRIINENHFGRLVNLVDSKDIKGFNINRNKLHIPPTIVKDVSKEDTIMKSEIFGPLLPVLEYEDLDQVENYLESVPKPLALYIFTSDDKKSKRITNTTSSGSVIINDVLIQAVSPYLPFGGVGKSGMGRYRGQSSLFTFSNKKSVVNKSFFMDFDFRYPPYDREVEDLKKYLKLVR
ncbi:MAG: aldehyde dehydrogenase family protein, partial [Elusimicrobiota bacterium]